MTPCKDFGAKANEGLEKHTTPATDEDKALLTTVRERLADPRRVKVVLEDL